MTEPTEPQWVDTQAIAPRMLNRTEIAALQQMFSMQGWQVWMDLCRIECDAAAEGALALVQNEEKRQQNRAVYHVRVNDITFSERLVDHLRTAPEVHTEPDDIMVSPVAIPHKTWLRRVLDML